MKISVTKCKSEFRLSIREEYGILRRALPERLVADGELSNGSFFLIEAVKGLKITWTGVKGTEYVYDYVTVGHPERFLGFQPYENLETIDVVEAKIESGLITFPQIEPLDWVPLGKDPRLQRCRDLIDKGWSAKEVASRLPHGDRDLLETEDPMTLPAHLRFIAKRLSA